MNQTIVNLSNDTQYVQPLLKDFSEVEMAKCCVYLALDLLKEAQSMHIEEVDPNLFNPTWWKEFMLIDANKLLRNNMSYCCLGW